MLDSTREPPGGKDQDGQIVVVGFVVIEGLGGRSGELNANIGKETAVTSTDTTGKGLGIGSELPAGQAGIAKKLKFAGGGLGGWVDAQDQVVASGEDLTWLKD